MLREISSLIRDIIIIIVAATFIELLLPRKEFHRYVRMVVGLIIILTLISAVNRFLGVRPDAASFFRQLEGPGGADAPALEEGFFKERVLGEYRARVALEAEGLAREFLQGEAKARAEVELAEEGEIDGEIAVIRLYLSQSGGAGEGGVEPIVIRVGPPEEARGEDLSPAPDFGDRPLKEHVARYFNLEARQVEVIRLGR